MSPSPWRLPPDRTMRHHALIGLLLVLGTAAASSPARADVITLEPAKDGTLYQEATGFIANGSGPTMFAGRTNINNVRRAILAFDLSGVPPGSTVNSVSLKLSIASGHGTHGVGLHRLLADWGEGPSDAGYPGGSGAVAEDGDATWIHTFRPTDLWTTPGGDFDPSASDTRPVGTAGTVIYGSTPAMVADVQGWVNARASNFGWLLRGEETTSQSAKAFDTHEGPASMRPILLVDFTPPLATIPVLPPWGPAVLALVLAACGASVLARRGPVAR